MNVAAVCLVASVVVQCTLTVALYRIQTTMFNGIVSCSVCAIVMAHKALVRTVPGSRLGLMSSPLQYYVQYSLTILCCLLNLDHIL